MDADGFSEWLESYRKAWEEMDPEAAGELFAKDAIYQETPFDDPFEGRAEIEDYWQDVTADQNDPRVDVEVLAVADGEGIGRFHTEFTDDDGVEVTMDGVCTVVFDGNVAVEFREWWHKETK